MKKILIASLALAAGLFARGAGDGKGVTETAWNRIAALEDFVTETADASMFNLPESFKEGQLAVHPNSSLRREVTEILDGISEDYLLGELSDDSFDERLFVETTGEDNCLLLYTIVGSGGADTVAFLITVTDAQADEAVALWEKHIKQEEEGKEEFDQDFGDE